MSIRINLAAAALAVTLAALSGQGSANAQARCNGTPHRTMGGTIQCYYLPTVSNGRVTGLREQVDFHSSRSVGPVYHPTTPSNNCRSLPTVVDGRVTGSHQVCG
jgi:hypothetical protein